MASFSCGVCKKQITLGVTDRVRVTDKQPISSNGIVNLETYTVESECETGQIHVNIVIIDKDGKYRGHKHAETKVSDRVDDEMLSDLRQVLKFGNDLAKVFSVTLQGGSIFVCGEEETCQRWSRVLPRFFTLGDYVIKPWIYLIEDFVKEYGNVSIRKNGIIGLIDGGLIRQAITTFPSIPRAELRNRTVYEGKSLAYAQNLTKMLLAIPDSENRALLILLSTQLDELRNLRDEITQKLNNSLIETVVLKAGDMSDLDFMDMVLEQVFPPDSLRDLRLRMKHEELEILSPHLIQSVPALNRALQRRE
jgi:hypothetical protein